MHIGDEILICDDIEWETVIHKGTIKLIEPDNEMPLSWLYIRACDESMNTNYDPRIGYFWRIIESVSDLIVRE